MALILLMDSTLETHKIHKRVRNSQSLEKVRPTKHNGPVAISHVVWPLYSSQKEANVSSGPVCAIHPITIHQSTSEEFVAIIEHFRAIAGEKVLSCGANTLGDKLEFGGMGAQLVETEGEHNVLSQD